MESTGTCPRGHAIEENAVYCTVCWVRLEPEDPEVVAARRRRRRFRLPFLATAAVLIGAGAGVLLSQASPTEPTLVAEPATSAPGSIVAAGPSPSAEQPIVVSQPEAATVADPVIAAQSECSITIDGTTSPCSVTDGQLVFEVCVPQTTATLEARSRTSEDAGWIDVSTDVVLGTSAGCDDGFVTADVVVDAADAGAGDGSWKLVARDSAGDKVWKAKFETTQSAE